MYKLFFIDLNLGLNLATAFDMDKTKILKANFQNFVSKLLLY